MRKQQCDVLKGVGQKRMLIDAKDFKTFYVKYLHAFIFEIFTCVNYVHVVISV